MSHTTSPSVPSHLSHALAGYSTSEHSANYDQTRTDYTEESIYIMVENTLIPYIQQHTTLHEFTVIDVGSGTGKFLRPLDHIIHHNLPSKYPSLFQQHNVHIHIKAIEPVADMRRTAKERSPHIDILDGHGEALPLPNSSVSLAICSQSFHWFATTRAIHEFYRILRPDGYLCLIWNTRNTSVAWVKQLDDIIDTYYPPDVPRQQDNSWKQCLIDADQRDHMLTPLKHIHLANHIVTRYSIENLIKYLLSISVIAALSEEEKTKAVKKFHQLLSTHPETKGKEAIELPFNTDIFYTQKM